MLRQPGCTHDDASSTYPAEYKDNFHLRAREDVGTRTFPEQTRLPVYLGKAELGDFRGRRKVCQ
jgi:hypothetical protein